LHVLDHARTAMSVVAGRVDEISGSESDGADPADGGPARTYSGMSGSRGWKSLVERQCQATLHPYGPMNTDRTGAASGLIHTCSSPFKNEWAKRRCQEARKSRRIGRDCPSERLAEICDRVPRPDTATPAPKDLRVLRCRGRGAQGHRQLLTAWMENRVLTVPLYPGGRRAPFALRYC
jgi:hypothetical protein